MTATIGTMVRQMQENEMNRHLPDKSYEPGHVKGVVVLFEELRSELPTRLILI